MPGMKVGEMFYDVVANTGPALRDLDKFKQRAQRVGQNMAAVGRKMTMALTLPILGVAAAAVKVASDAEEMESKFNAVFKASAKDVRDWAATHATSVNRSKYDLMEYAATVQDTFVPMGFARDAAAELSKSMVELAVDVASFNNKAEPDVIRDFQSALVGNHETVRKYGIVITQAALDQELLNMGFAGGARNASEQMKVQARLNLIMKGTTDAQGDAARTAGSFANQLKGLKADLKEIGIELGKTLIPMLKQLIKEGKPVLEWFKDLTPEQKKWTMQIGLAVAAIGPLLSILGNLVTALSKVGPALGVFSAVGTGPLAVAIGGITTLGLVINEVFAGAEREITNDLKRASKAAKDELQFIGEQFKRLQQNIKDARIIAELSKIVAALQNVRTETGLLDQEKLDNIQREFAEFKETVEDEDPSPEVRQQIAAMEAAINRYVNALQDVRSAEIRSSEHTETIWESMVLNVRRSVDQITGLINRVRRLLGLPLPRPKWQPGQDLDVTPSGPGPTGSIIRERLTGISPAMRQLLGLFAGKAEEMPISHELELANQLIMDMGNALSYSSDEFREIQFQLRDFRERLEEDQLAVLGFKGAHKLTREELQDMFGQLVANIAKISEFGDVNKDQIKVLDKWLIVLTGVERGLTNTIEMQEGWTEETKKTTNAIDALTISANLLDDAIKESGIWEPEGVGGIKLPAWSGTAMLSGMAGGEGWGKIPADMLEGVSDGLATVEGDLKIIGEKGKKAIAGMADEATKLATSLKSALTNAITESIMAGKLSWDNLVDMIERTVINVAVNALVSGSSVAGALSGIPIIGDVLGVFGLAEGGTLQTAGSVMVGEEGPEILSLPAGAQVTPLGAMGDLTTVIQLDGREIARKTLPLQAREMQLRGISQ